MILQVCSRWCSRRRGTAYNAANAEGEALPVTVKSVEALQDGSRKVVVKQQYDSVATYSDYNGAVLFYGTVEQAKAQDYDLNVELADVKKGKAVRPTGCVG